MTWQKEYLQKFYHNKPGWIDGTTEFHNLCAAYISKKSMILEIGAGPSNSTSRYLKTIGALHGVDIGDEVLSNDALETAYVIKDNIYPYAAKTFDACVSNYVVEHVANPQGHLAEVNRVLKPGGVYLFRTPNLYHYVSLVSKFTPHGFHLLVANRLRNLSEDTHDPWPTVYLMNTQTSIDLQSRDSGFNLESLKLIEKEPYYGLSSPFLFLPLLVYERIVNSSEAFRSMRANIFAVLRKKI